MEDILDLLVTIQRLDDEIKEAQSIIQGIPHTIAKLEKTIADAHSNFQEKSNRVKEIKKMYKIKEGDIAENESKITKLNSQTFSVKTNEEYRAIIAEIDYLKKENEKTEDEMMVLLEEEEQLKSAVSKMEEETKDIVENKKAEITNLENEREALIAKQQQAKISFDEHFKKLPQDTQEVYRRISNVRDRVVCVITNTTCTGCYANLTFQFLNELKKRNKILLCDNCGRILIFVPSTK
jgi:predicted  nucleic acid-binding Zn-ribbon protein